MHLKNNPAVTLMPLWGSLTLAVILLAGQPASALLIGDDGLLEPVIVLIKDSLRTSTSNDSWQSLVAPIDELSEAGFSPNSIAESALWPILKSGLYTTILSGVSGGTGVGLIEMYEY
ncbi:hypothetical protein BH20VER3_BH20VER3_06570 [soil metagenome]